VADTLLEVGCARDDWLDFLLSEDDAKRIRVIIFAGQKFLDGRNFTTAASAPSFLLRKRLFYLVHKGVHVPRFAQLHKVAENGYLPDHVKRRMGSVDAHALLDQHVADPPEVP
jgi:hypothetical protein